MAIKFSGFDGLSPVLIGVFVFCIANTISCPFIVEAASYLGGEPIHSQYQGHEGKCTLKIPDAKNYAKFGKYQE